MSKNLSELSFRKGLSDNLFENLIDVDDDRSLEKLAKDQLIGTANVLGAMSFYDFLKPENKDKKVYICNGTACECAGTQEDVKSLLSTHFKNEEMGHMTCLGRCYENSAFHINGVNYSGNEITKLSSIIEGATLNSKEYNVEALGKAILTASFPGLDQYKSLLEKSLKMGQVSALEEIKKANIRGRGGAGFPMGIKLEGCRNQDSDHKYIICNADEGDPGAYSDRYLLEKQPYYVLFGMMIAGWVTGADVGILYIRAEYPDSVFTVKHAIQQLRSEGLLGKDILGSGFNYEFKIIQAQGAYICGEETALINSIEGQRPEVRTRPPYPVVQGLFNKPTIVNNVETLAAVYYIMDKGGADYAAMGTEKSKGTKLICLDSFFNKPGVYEVEMGSSLSEVFNKLGGGFKTKVKAVQIGGPLGGLVPSEKFEDLKVDFESFANAGFLLGHASVISIPDEFPMIDFLVHLMDFAAYESCGKCFPCRLGTKRAHEMLLLSKNGEYKIDRKLFDDLLTTLTQGSLCAHGGGIPLPVRNTMMYFEDELKQYFD